MATSYFVDEQTTPPTLLRRVDFVDRAFRDGAWVPTRSVIDWQFGNDDFVSEISDAKAREIAPAAFTSPA